MPCFTSSQRHPPTPGCHCGLSCTGFDPVCTDRASSHSETCCSLSLPPHLLLMLPCEGTVGARWACLHGQPRAVGVSALTQWGQGPMDTGLSLHIPLLPLLQAVLRLILYSQKFPVGWSIQHNNPWIIFSQVLSPAPWNYFPNTLSAQKPLLRH